MFLIHYLKLYSSLPYVEATMAEIFRFRGAAPLTVPHKALRDTILQVTIPSVFRTHIHSV